MKKYLVLILLSVFTLISCSTYYQVYSIAPDDDMGIANDFIIYENDECKVVYDLWEEGGNIGFAFINKTDENIFINLDECFFILNGHARDYYKDRKYSASAEAAISLAYIDNFSIKLTGLNTYDLIQSNQISLTDEVKTGVKIGYDTAYSEKRIVCIPPNSFKLFFEYNINKTFYDLCDFNKYPSPKNIESRTFSEETSPISFSNVISYSRSKLETRDKTIVHNKFIVSEITNYPESEMFEYKYEMHCGEQSSEKKKHCKVASPDKFYIKYNVNQY